MSLEQIMGDVMIAYPNTRSMCSANGDGAAAAVVVSDSKLRTLSQEQQRRAVKVSASVLTSDPWQEACQVLPDVNTLTRNAAATAYEAAGVGPEDLDLVELHDCFATAELVHYDNLGLCEPGGRSEEHTSELQSLRHLVCRLLLVPCTTAPCTLSLHDALPISIPGRRPARCCRTSTR